MLATLLSAILAVIVIVIWRSKGLSTRAHGLREPSGPKTRPLIGNLLDLPFKSPYPHEAFAVMAQRYGDMFRLKLPNKTIIIVTNAKIVDDLHEKRGSVYSDRARFPMAQLAGWGWNLVTLRHGAAWRARRRLAHQHLYGKEHLDMQYRTALVLAQRLLDVPTDFIAHIRHAAGANIMRTTYGIEVELENDPYVALAERAMAGFSLVITPARWVVDSIPALQFVPTWFPGASFKRYAVAQRALARALLEVPFSRTEKDMNAGIALPSMVADALAQNPVGESLTALKEAAAVMYLGGADTTVSALVSFVSAMVRYPEVQHAAHKEILRVVGSDRLPTFADRASLPYVEAVIREVYRLYPVVTLVGHAAEQDDVYEGMYIAKGTLVTSNVWAILRDPKVYEDPQEFRPSRFLRDGKIDPNVPDPKSHCFGYGRRVCPGKQFADTSIFIEVAIILAAFEIKPAMENGLEVVPEGKFFPGVIRTPIPFNCVIVPRFASANALIKHSLEDL